MTTKIDELTANVKLRFPVTVDGVEYTSLTMRQPRTRDNIVASKRIGNDAERGVFMLARLCDVSPDVIEELYEIDAMALSAQLDLFRGR
jgi:hypothetical protein